MFHIDLAALQANALAIKQEELNKTSSLSTNSLASNSSNEQSNLYADLLPLPLRMFTQQMFAASQPSALLAAHLNQSANFYPHPLFSWQYAPLANSPPISPISPTHSVQSAKRINNNNNNIVSTTTVDKNASNINYINSINNNNNIKELKSNISNVGVKNGRKSSKTRRTANFEKKRNPNLFQPYPNSHSTLNAVNRNMSPGPLSPPTSGSSPQSLGSIEHQSPSSSSVHATPIKTPTRDKSFTCQTCKRSFGYKHVLQNHERTHTGEKPFKCPECGKRFTRDHHLKTHMRLHTGEKPYHCEYCDRQFVQVANLRRHIRVHTGDKPYACDKCNSKFSDSNQLKSHVLIHNQKEEKLFRCEICNGHHPNNQKCTNGPLTPATSPITLADNKSIASRSDASDTFHDLNQSTELTILKQIQFNQSQRTHALQQIYESTLSNAIESAKVVDMPLDLSVGGNEKRNRKSNDVRHILRMPKQIISVAAPQQHEPEDLSMHSPRSASSLLSEDNFDDLDDAESLNRKRHHIQDITETDG